MSKNFDSRQTEHRSELPRLSDAAKPTLKTILPQIDAELTPVFELRASSTPDLTVNIGSGSIVNSDTGLTRSFSPIDGQYFNYTGGTVVFPAADGGTITIAGGINSTLVMADDTYMAVLIQINSIGEVSVSQGVAVAVEADTLLAANFPVPNGGELPIGYVVLQNIAGTVQVIENEKIVQFESGGGGSGSGDAVGFESEMDDLLNDSFYEYYAPVIFPRDKEVFINDANSTGDFKNADGIYQLEIGQVFESTNLFDTEFIARNIKSLQKQLIVDYFDDASRDDGATYEVSIDGGVTYETITMERQEGTVRYIGQLKLADNATYDDLRVRITASEAETKLENVAVFYNEELTGIVGGINQSQTFVINGSDNVTGFTLTKFLPDPNITKMYVEETGQVFRGSALSINGYVVSVPSGTLEVPGETLTVTIQQLEGNSFDNSDDNANKIGNLEQSLINFGKANFEDSVEPALIDAPNTIIKNRAQIESGLRTSMGVERIRFTEPQLVPNEYGPNNEPVFAASKNDSRIRVINTVESESADNGGYRYRFDSSERENILEVTFYGTGLNLLGYGGSARACFVSTDGGAEVDQSYDISSILNSRGYASNVIREMVSGLSEGWHTVRIRNPEASPSDNFLYGVEIVNSAAQIRTLQGSGFAGLLKQTLPNNSLYDYTPSAMSSNGGRVKKYILNGEIGEVFTDIGVASYLDAADFSDSDLIRSINFQEFGAGNSNDFSEISGFGNRGFTLDDGTTTLVAQDVDSVPGAQTGEDVLIIDDGTSNFYTLTFVGTGLAIERENQDANVRSDSVFVDGIDRGDIALAANELKVQTICANLPYGTHTVKIQNNSGALNGGHVKNFYIYQPKAPVLPNGAVEIADYNVMANYVATTDVDPLSKSSGVLTKACVREFTYNGTWDISTTNTDAPFYFLLSTSSGSVEYTFFGEGFDFLFRDDGASASATIEIDGVAYTGAATTVSVGGSATWTPGTSTWSSSGGAGNSAKFQVSGLTLGFHTVKLTRVSGTIRVNGIDIITPIHINESALKTGSLNLISNQNYKAPLKNYETAIMDGAAKALIVFDASSNKIVYSKNISAVIDIATGFFDYYFEVPFKHVPVVIATSASSLNRYSGSPDRHKCRIANTNTGGTGQDQPHISVAVYGELEGEE